jgi:hypothetical protein
VTIDGKDYYLGRYDTPASKQKYASLIRVWQERQATPNLPRAEPLRPSDQATINDLVLVYLKYAEEYYKPNQGENREAGCISDALDFSRSATVIIVRTASATLSAGGQNS